MTGKTHQLIALASVTAAGVTFPPPVLGIAGSILALAATMLGALTPDIDHPASNLWKLFPAGSVVGRIARVFLGGHRNVTHSLLAAYVIIRFSHSIVGVVRPEFLPIAETAWRAYVIGFLSHLISDTFTDRGVPWLWPIRWNIALPPGPQIFRITTGSAVEHYLLIPSLSLFILLLWFRFWDLFRAVLGI